MVNASKKKDLIMDAATMANPSALVHSHAIVFLLALSLEPKILKTTKHQKTIQNQKNMVM